MFEKIHFNRQSTGLASNIWIIILKHLSSRAEVTLTKGLTEDTALSHLPKYWNKIFNRGGCKTGYFTPLTFSGERLAKPLT